MPRATMAGSASSRPRAQARLQKQVRLAPRPQAFELTPNPASSFVDIRLEVKQNTNARNTVKFFNAAGRVVLDVPYVTDRGQQPRSQRVDISTLPDGCYFVAVEPSGQGRVQKVIKTGKQ